MSGFYARRVPVEQLAARAIVQPLARRIWRLIEGVHSGDCDVADRMYAVNALHLLRDALLDAEGVAGLLTGAVRRLLDLQRQQVEAMTFHGPLHEEYHDAARQVRAAAAAGIVQSKRVLNQTADVVAAFVMHGVKLRSKSFGSQVKSAKTVLPTGDARTDALVALLVEQGVSLDANTYFRDKYLEHVHALRGSEQPRPSSGETALRFGVGEPGDDSQMADIVGAGFNWVRFKNEDSEYLAVHVIPVSNTARYIENVVLDHARMGGHFRNHDPHEHMFAVSTLGDWAERDTYTVAAISDVATTQGPILAYIQRLLRLCET